MEKTINIPVNGKNTNTILVICANNPDNLINVNDFITCINDILANTYKYDGNLFENMRIEVYEPNYPNSPFNGNNAVGLASAWKNLLQFKSNSFQSLSDMSNCLSHEFGHYKAYKSGFNDLNSPIRQKWNQIRGIHQTPYISKDELIAEDIRMFFGSRNSKDVWRTDSRQPHINPYNVKGLKEFVTIWKQTNDFINQLKQISSITDFDFHNSDVNYFEMRFKSTLFLTPWVQTWYKVDLRGIHTYTVTGWQPARLF